jgi:hypothetical protein
LPVKFIDRRCFDRGKRVDAGIVDENVDRTERRPDLCEKTPDVARIGDGGAVRPRGPGDLRSDAF